jgi:hypothetical protein
LYRYIKDLSTIIMSDNIVVKRQETPLSISGFTLACATSLLYNISNIYRRERERAEQEESASLIPERQEKTPGLTLGGKGGGGGGGGGGSGGGGGDAEDDGDTVYWHVNDAHNVMLTCCALGVLLLSSSILAQLNFVKVAGAYAPHINTNL